MKICWLQTESTLLTQLQLTVNDCVAGSGWASFTLFGAQYRLVHEPKNWTDAQAYCKTYMMSLPTIFSANHNTLLNTEVRKYLGSAVSWWSGGFCQLLCVACGAECQLAGVGDACVLMVDFGVGANDRSVEGRWVWADALATGNLADNRTGPANWYPWGQGQPSGLHNKNCGAVGVSGNTTAWADQLCNHTLPFVCTDEGQPEDSCKWHLHINCTVADWRTADGCLQAPVLLTTISRLSTRTSRSW